MIDRTELLSKATYATQPRENQFTIKTESDDKFSVEKDSSDSFVTEKSVLKDITDTTPTTVPPVDKTPEDITLSKKDLLNDDQYFQDILTYRKGRFNVDKTEGTNFVMLPFVKQDLTAENLIDDYLDHYRFITSNEIDVADELDWLKSLAKKESLALQNAKNAKSQNEQNRFLKMAEETSNLRKVSARLYKKTSQLATIFDTDRYKGMSLYEKVTDVIDTVGGHVATQISSPLSAISVGIGKNVAKELAARTGIGKVSQILIAAATTAPIDAVQAGVVDVVAQGAEIEMGIRKDYDPKRTATVAGVSGVTSGVFSGVGQRLALRKGSGLTKEGIEASLKKIKKQQGELASKKIKELGDQSKEFSDSFAKDIENTFGKKAVEKNAKGEVININEDVIKQAGREKIERLGKEGYKVDILEPAMNINTFKRVLASVGELMETGKKNIDDVIDIDDNLIRVLGENPVTYREKAKKEVQNLFRPLGKDEAISSRVFEILLNDNVKKDLPYQILAKYGVTHKDFSAMMLAEISRAGSKLATVRQLPNQLARGNRDKTIDELEEHLNQTFVSKRWSELYYRFENIRRATLVSGIATAQRNGLAQIPRVAIDTLIYGFESALNPNKKFSLRGTFSQMNYTFLNVADGVTISNALLDNFDVAKAKMWNQYSEVGHRLRKRNPNQHALSRVKTKKSDKELKAPKGLGGEKTSIVDNTLDKWENLIHHFNVFNRFQESLFRRGAFMASIERQLINKRQNLNLVDVMKEGTFLKHVDDKMMAKAVDDALEFTYASDPKFVPFKYMNSFFTKYLTYFTPFPRFMFKAMEMSYNYNVTGAVTGAYRTMAQAVTRGGFKAVDDGAYKQMAEGIAGSLVLMPLGYILRDPENGLAGSEYYKLKDNKGKEIDMRVFGPIITPYLLFGEMLHRAERGVTQIDLSEVFRAVSGANFRSFSSIDRTLGEFLKLASDGNQKALEVLAGGVGRVLGEAQSGYGQFFLQFSDIAPESDRRRDYKQDPIYEGALDAFTKEYSLPIKRRIDAFIDDPNQPFARDPRNVDVPERVLPFMKVLFGATLNRQPAKYIYELGAMGFDYDDFMAKTSMPSINRLANKITAELLQTEMNAYLTQLKQDPKLQTSREDLSLPKDVINSFARALGYPDVFNAKDVGLKVSDSLYGDAQSQTKFDLGKAVGYVDSYIKSIKKQSLAEAKAEIDKDNELLGILIRYKGINPKARMSAEKMYISRKAKLLNKKEEDVTIDYDNYKEMYQLFKEAGNIRNEGELYRKYTPKKQRGLFN